MSEPSPVQLRLAQASRRALSLGLSVSCLCSLLSMGCTPEKPPAPEGAPVTATPESSGPVFWKPESETAVLSYAAERGAFADAKRPSEVPEQARSMVRVSLLDGRRAPAGQVWVANLENLKPEGFELKTVPRELFEELALGTGQQSEVSLPAGIEAPDVQLAAGLVVYKTSWCGVCKKLEAYLKRKGVEYEAKDIEKDPAAAAELRAKAEKTGLKTNSVPVVDLGPKGDHELMVGFDRARLERLLG